MSLAASPGVKEALAFALSPLFCCEAAIRAELCDKRHCIRLAWWGIENKAGAIENKKRGTAPWKPRSSCYHEVYARWHASCSSSIGIDVPPSRWHSATGSASSVAHVNISSIKGQKGQTNCSGRQGTPGQG